MRLAEVIDSDKAGALDIQRYVIETFDDTAVASSGEPMIDASLTQFLGLVGVKLSVDLPYFKDSIFLYRSGHQFRMREYAGTRLGADVGDPQHSAEEVVETAISIMAVEGADDERGPFIDAFKKAHRISDAGIENHKAQELFRLILEGCKMLVLRNDMPPTSDFVVDPHAYRLWETFSMTQPSRNVVRIWVKRP